MVSPVSLDYIPSRTLPQSVHILATTYNSLAERIALAAYSSKKISMGERFLVRIEILTDLVESTIRLPISLVQAVLKIVIVNLFSFSKSQKRS